MKRKLLIVGMLAVLLAGIIPVLASAGNSGTTTVTGTVGATIELTPPSTISLGALTTGFFNPGSSATPGTVTSNTSSWSVTAIDQNTLTNKGCMMSGTNPLGGKLQISKNNADFVSADTGITYDSNPASLPLYVKQYVSASDKAGTYSITIVFTATGS